MNYLNGKWGYLNGLEGWLVEGLRGCEGVSVGV